VRMNGHPAGLVLVKRGSEISGGANVWDMAEFFVVRGHRRRGMGTRIAHDVWRRFPGRWEVRVMKSNGPACQFWGRVIAGFTGRPAEAAEIEKNGKCWRAFAFDSPSVTPSQ
jgi:predicted acetyltransferase